MTDMTNTPDSTSTDVPKVEYPTSWHLIDVLKGIECRQTSEKEYQLRTKTHIITIDPVGFELFRMDPVKFDRWLEIHNVKSYNRNDVDEDTISAEKPTW
jgi:hypothetical protein